MIRTLTAVGLSVALPLGALGAPLVHVHTDTAETSHHHGHEIHAHLGGHLVLPVSPAGRQLDDRENDRAVSLQFFVGTTQTAFTTPAAVVPSLEFAAPGEAPARHPVRVVHGHDPPGRGTPGPRAPPAFPS